MYCIYHVQLHLVEMKYLSTYMLVVGQVQSLTNNLMNTVVSEITSQVLIFPIQDGPCTLDLDLQQGLLCC